MVGNMSDIQADTATSEYIPHMFCRKITHKVKKQPAMANIFSSNPGLRYLKIKVQIKRLMQNIIIAIMLYFWDRTSAAFSSIP